MERRKAHRYDLMLQAVVNSNVENVCRTRDMSRDGIFLLLSQPITTVFNVTIELPKGVYIEVVARTVRTQEWVERGKRVIGVGAVIGRREIVRQLSSRCSPFD